MSFEIAKIIVVCLIVFLGFTAFTGAPYVPSMKKELRQAFKKLYPLKKKDFLVDLGSGDGVVLKIASEFGASGLGVELNPLLALISKIRLRKHPNLSIKNGNLFKLDFPKETTVVYIFGDSRDILDIVIHVQNQANKLGKKLFLISNAFMIPGYEPVNQHRSYFLYEIKPVIS